MSPDDPKETETFVRAMDSLVKARGDAEVLAEALDWNNATEFLDVGSGPATYPIALCRRFPGLRATIFDLPGTLKFTQRYVRAATMEHRIGLIAGDYRKDAIPEATTSFFFRTSFMAKPSKSMNRCLANWPLFLNRRTADYQRPHLR